MPNSHLDLIQPRNITSISLLLVISSYNFRNSFLLLQFPNPNLLYYIILILHIYFHDFFWTNSRNSFPNSYHKNFSFPLPLPSKQNSQKTALCINKRLITLLGSRLNHLWLRLRRLLSKRRGCGHETVGHLGGRDAWRRQPLNSRVGTVLRVQEEAHGRPNRGGQDGHLQPQGSPPGETHPSLWISLPYANPLCNPPPGIPFVVRARFRFNDRFLTPAREAALPQQHPSFYLLLSVDFRLGVVIWDVVEGRRGEGEGEAVGPRLIQLVSSTGGWCKVYGQVSG